MRKKRAFWPAACDKQEVLSLCWNTRNNLLPRLKRTPSHTLIGQSFREAAKLGTSSNSKWTKKVGGLCLDSAHVTSPKCGNRVR
jgi:hypothetical protein